MVNKIESIINKIGSCIKKNLLQLIAMAIALFGLVVLVIFVVIVNRNYPVTLNNPSLENTALIGDFVGGFIGALWSFAGVLLFYSALKTQQKEFNLQREELNSQKQEFASSRITTVIYRQLELLAEKGKVVDLSKLTLTHFGEKLIASSNDDDDDDNDFSEDIKLLKSEDTKEYLRYLAITLEVCIELIEQIQENSQEENKYILDDNQKARLYMLLEGNLKPIELFNDLISIKNIYTIDINKEGFSFFTERDISDIDKIMSNLEKVSKQVRKASVGGFGLLQY